MLISDYSTKRHPTSLIRNSLSDDGGIGDRLFRGDWCLTAEEVGIVRGSRSGNTRLAPQVVVLKTKAFMSKVASFINPRLTEGWGTTFSASRIWTERLVAWILRPATGQA